MNRLARSLREGRWGWSRRGRTRVRPIHTPGTVRALVAAMFDEQPEVRKRAADVAHRVTDMDVSLLRPYADELGGLLAETLPEESRTLCTWG